MIGAQLPAEQLPDLMPALLKRVEVTPAVQKELRAAMRDNAQ